MKTQFLPVPDPPGTKWEEIADPIMVDEDGRRGTFNRVWVDPDSLIAGTANEYLRHRIEVSADILLTMAVAGDVSAIVTQYGRNPEAVRVDYAPFPPMSVILKWARQCHAHEHGRAA